jgi:glycosyltransferase involved in cell wall biosynthesis
MSDRAAESGETTPRLSIIVPAFNAADHLEQSIRELVALAASTPDPSRVEIVVVDDGSSDDTAAVGSRLAELNPAVRFFSLPQNVGVALARKRAVEESRGDYLWFVDADDARAPAAAQVLLTAADSGADIVLFGAEYVYEGGRRRPVNSPRLAAPVGGKEAFRLLLEGAISGHLWNKLFRRSLAQQITFTPARVHSDLAMVAQLIAAAGSVSSIDDVLYSYQLRGGSIIRSGTRRAESLLLVGTAVETAATTLDPRIVASSSFQYFRTRYIVLSGMKDALAGPYDEGERAALVAGLRAQLTPKSVLALAQRRDWKRVVLAGSALVSIPLHQRVLRLASERPQ